MKMIVGALLDGFSSFPHTQVLGRCLRPTEPLLAGWNLSIYEIRTYAPSGRKTLLEEFLVEPTQHLL